MVDDLQTVASAEAAALHLVREPCDLAVVAESAATAIASTAKAAGVELSTDLEPVVIDGDPVRLHQIATNLLSNAVKYTPAGGTVAVEVGQHDGQAVLSVADTGQGIPAADLPHIFDRFWRGRDEGAAAGTGIGLSIVHNLVAAHDGTIRAESEPGSGTRVTVVFPVTRSVAFPSI
jgi:two-component system sensor histidine kinase BaeS